MGPPAAELLRRPNLTVLSRRLLELAAALEHRGARDWDARAVAVASLATLAVVQGVFRKRRGVDWYALLHGVVSAAGALACCYLDFHAESLTGTTEPLRSCRCEGPLTVLHRILPAVTAGYSLLDLYDGYFLGPDFLMHGAVTLAIMTFFLAHDVPHLIEPMLLMEVSTPFLTVVRADFLGPAGAVAVQAAFALCFFAFRIVLVPYIWVQLMATMYRERFSATYQACIPPSLFPVSLAIGLFFHILNLYWFVKIVRKARRKLLGVEGVQSNNDLTEAELEDALKKVQ